jgi:hypothetical protein
MDPDTFMLYFFLVIIYALCVILPVLFYHTNIPITAAVAFGFMVAVVGVIFATRSLEIGILSGIFLAASILPNLPKR